MKHSQIYDVPNKHLNKSDRVAALLQNIDFLQKASLKKRTLSEIGSSLSETNQMSDDLNDYINQHKSVSETGDMQTVDIQTVDNNTVDNKTKKIKNKQKKVSKPAELNEKTELNERTITDEFAKHIMSYIEIDDKINDKLEKIKELKNIKKQHEEYILTYLENIHQTIILYDGVTLRKNEYLSKGSIKNDYIKEMLSTEVQDPIKINKMIEFLENKKEAAAIKRIGLKRTKCKK